MRSQRDFERKARELAAELARADTETVSLRKRFPKLRPHRATWERQHRTATKAGKPTGRKTYEWEEFSEAVPLRFRRKDGLPIDEALETAKREGLLPHDATEGDFLEAYRHDAKPDYLAIARQMLQEQEEYWKTCRFCHGPNHSGWRYEGKAICPACLHRKWDQRQARQAHAVIDFLAEIGDGKKEKRGCYPRRHTER